MQACCGDYMKPRLQSFWLNKCSFLPISRQLVSLGVLNREAEHSRICTPHRDWDCSGGFCMVTVRCLHWCLGGTPQLDSLETTIPRGTISQGSMSPPWSPICAGAK